MEAVENLCLGPKHKNIGTAITIKLQLFLFCRILGVYMTFTLIRNIYEA